MARPATRPIDWLARPLVIVIGILLIAPFVWRAVRALRSGETREAPAPAKRSLVPATGMSIGLLVLFAYAWWTAIGFLAGASLMPLTVAVGGTLLCVVQVVQELRGRSRFVVEDDEAVESGRVRQALGYLAGIALYTVMMGLFGMRSASLLCVLGFLLVVVRMRWLSALGYTAVVVAGLEALSALLGVHLPRGLIPLFW